MKKNIFTMLSLLAFSNSFAQTPNLPPMKITKAVDLPTYLPASPPVPPSDFSTILKDNIYNGTSATNPSFEFNGVTISKLFQLIFGEATQYSYVLSPEVINDERLVSFRYNSNRDGKLDKFLLNFLKMLNYDMSLKNNVYFVIQSKEQAEPIKKDTRPFSIYTPKNRDTSYLQDNAKFLFPSAFSNTNASLINSGNSNNIKDPKPNTPTDLMQRSQEIIIYRADTKDELNQIESFFLQIDTKPKQIYLKFYVYQVTYADDDKSAYNIILNLAGGKLSSNIGPSTPLDNFFKVSTSAFQFVFSQISTDNRFKLISQPFLIVENQQTTSFNVTSDIPTLGAITTSSTGSSIQSIERLSAGLQLTVKAKAYQEQINLDIQETLSDAVATQIGYQSSPTINRRDLKTNFSMSKNQVVLLSGLVSNQNTSSKSAPSLLPFFKSDNENKNKTELFMLVTAVEQDDIKQPQELKNATEIKN